MAGSVNSRQCTLRLMEHAQRRDKADAKPLAPGLYIVATPIGNLGDMTLRAISVLKQVDVIACEDTRHTRNLLDHYGIPTATISYHEHNEGERAAELIARLQQGERIALVSDAGTPAISDPGYRVVSAAAEAGIRIIPLPGPVAFATALAASGLPTDEFSFRGFLPARRGERRTALEFIAGSGATEIFYEAPHRLIESLEDVVHILGPERPVVIARELTKVHEEFVRGPAAEVLERFRQQAAVKGEIVLLIGKAMRMVHSKSRDLNSRLDALMADGLDEKGALKQLAKEAGLSRDELFRELQRSRKR
jgi:16S rRNA (cytidine1402-2'-O)-methyltransferase